MQPNSEMSAFNFREMMILHLLFWGNSYSNIIKNKGQDVIALWPLLPWNMEVGREKGLLIYRYKLPDNTKIIIPNEYILHIPGMSFDGLVGKSLISLAREAIGLGLALEEFGARFFGQGATFGGFIEHPKTLGSKAHANLTAAIKEKYQGISNAHKLMILEEGMTYKQNMIPPNDAQYIESRRFQKEESAMIFNVSPHLIKDLKRATLNNIEHLEIEHVIYTLMPWCKRIENAMSIKLIAQAERKTYFIEHLLDGLYRGDIKTRYEAYAIGKQWGWLNNRMIYRLENINVSGPEDDIKWMPLNMIDIKKVSVPLPEAIPESKNSRKLEIRAYRSATLKSRIANSYRGLFEETTGRIIKLEKTNILKAAKSMFKKRSANISDFNEFLEDFYKKKYGEINKRSKPVINTYGKVVFDAAVEEVGANPEGKELDKFMDEYTEAFNARYIATSKGRLADTVQTAIDGELDPYNAVESKFTEWEQTRPHTVSLKETIKIAGAVSLLAYGLAGVTKMIWVNTGSKSCPFCEEMNGQVMGIEQPFKLKSDLMEADGKEPLTFSSNIFHPPLHGGCQCQIVPG